MSLEEEIRAETSGHLQGPSEHTGGRGPSTHQAQGGASEEADPAWALIADPFPRTVRGSCPACGPCSPVARGPCDGLGWTDAPESGPRFDQQVARRPAVLKLQSQGFSWSLCLLKTPEATSPTGASSARMLLAPGLRSCWEYTGSTNEKCTLVVSAPPPTSACNRPLNFAALGSWGAAGQQGLLHPGTPYAGAPLSHHAWHYHNATDGLAIPRLPVRLGSAQPQEAMPLAVADLGQVPRASVSPYVTPHLLTKIQLKCQSPGLGPRNRG